MVLSLRIQAVAALLCLGAAACQTTPRLVGRDTQVISGPLERLNPVDVAVAPLRLAGPGMNVPQAEVRRAAQLGLARRRYSPLSLDLVDRTVEASTTSLAGTTAAGTLEASYAAGDVGEDAVLEITVDRWDTRNWNARRSLDVAVEARLVDPADPFGPPLWAGRLEKVVDVSGLGGLDSSGQRGLEAACSEIFRELFARLPARDIEPPSGLDEGAGFPADSGAGAGDGR